MWILVIFCMLVVVGIWKINLNLNKSREINSDNYSDLNNLNLPSFSKLEEELDELNKEIDGIEKINEEEIGNLEKELFNENKKEVDNL